MQIVIFIIILIHEMMHNKSWYVLSRVPYNFVNISPESCKGKTTSVPCFSWSLLFADIKFFHAIGENHAELQSTDLETHEIVLFFNFCCLF